MRPRPVACYPAPAYPTRAEMARDPELLRSHLPPGWQQRGAMASVVAFFMTFAAAGCQSSSGPGATPGNAPVVPIAPSEPSQPGAQPAVGSSTGQEQPGPEVMKVAPVFEHGDGRGAVGCVVVSPPVFLSEDEAFAVVREELARHGIDLSDRGVPVAGVVIPKTRDEYSMDASGSPVRKTVEMPGQGKPLELDGVSRKRHVAVEVVCESDYFDLGGTQSMSTVQSYDLKERAASVAEKLRAQGKEPLYVGVFYDPAGHIEFDRSPGAARPDWETIRREQTEKSKELLRAQVRDFVSWIRGKTSLI